jgi:hypothetical protein
MWQAWLHNDSDITRRISNVPRANHTHILGRIDHVIGNTVTPAAVAVALTTNGLHPDSGWNRSFAYARRIRERFESLQTVDHIRP